MSPFYSLSSSWSSAHATLRAASALNQLPHLKAEAAAMASITRKRLSSSSSSSPPFSPHSHRWIAASSNKKKKDSQGFPPVPEAAKIRRSLHKQFEKLGDDCHPILHNKTVLGASVGSSPPCSAKGSSGLSFESLLSARGVKGCDPSNNTDEDLGFGEWKSLGVRPSELSLSLTLLTGQSFRWRQTGPSIFTGVLGLHLLSLKQTNEDILFHLHYSSSSGIDRKAQKVADEGDGKDVAKVLYEYFNLGTSLVSLWKGFSAADERFAAVAPYVVGARLLRQNPLECVFQFICSSNNHIQRISQMVEYLSSLGPFLGSINGHNFHAFPSLDQLSAVTETQLRAAGFGYRAKYVVGTVEALQTKDGGGLNWLHSLKDMPLEQATEALCTLPGIGPKVATCIALFSLDKHQAIPVDTHVWQIAVRYVAPELAGEQLSPKLHAVVSDAFVRKFGEYAGWAQTVLFISELSAYQNLLPLHLQSPKIKLNQKKSRHSI